MSGYFNPCGGLRPLQFQIFDRLQTIEPGSIGEKNYALKDRAGFGSPD